MPYPIHLNLMAGRGSVEEQLIKSGERDRLKELLRQRLRESG